MYLFVLVGYKNILNPIISAESIGTTFIKGGF